MHISQLRIKNYKSFKDSGDISLSPGFNVLLGRNNSGKSAFLEALKRGENGNKPHRDPAMPRNMPSSPTSVFEMEVNLSAEELREALLRYGKSIWVPADPNRSAREIANHLFVDTGGSFRLSYHLTTLQLPAYPSHGLFKLLPRAGKIGFPISATPDRQDYQVGEPSSTADDQAYVLADHVTQRKIFAFSAERYNVAKVGFNASPKLTGTAANLPRALVAMREQSEL